MKTPLRFLFPFVCIVLSCAPVTTNTDTDAGSELLRCIPGQSEECSCPDGSSGAQVCNDDGTFDPCLCESGDVEDECETTLTGMVGCEEVDFLFVVDTSRSMEVVQANLVKSFPSFIKQIRGTLRTQDYNIMVVAADEYITDACEVSCCSHGSFSNCSNPGDGCYGYECGSIYEQDLCDQTIGAGIVFPMGYNTANRPCDFQDGLRYLTSDHPELEEAFSCAATLGTPGHGNEYPIGAMLRALDPELTGPGRCNEGFLRPNSILVVTILSDASCVTCCSDEQRQGVPQQWYEDLLAVKCGREDAIVMLVLTGDYGQEDGVCTERQQYSPKLIEFGELFGEQGFVGSICSDDYTPFFSAAVELVDRTCNDFMY